MSLESCVGCGYDSVTFFDGPDQSSPSLGKFCNFETWTNVSTGSSLFVLFESDNSVNDGRFSISWKFVNESAQGRCFTS